MFSSSCWDWEGAKNNTSLFFSWILNKLTHKTISDQNISFTSVRLWKRLFPLLSKDFFLVSTPPPTPDPPSHGQSWATTVPEKARRNDQILWSPMTRSGEPVISQIMDDPDALSSPRKYPSEKSPSSLAVTEVNGKRSLFSGLSSECYGWV